MTGRHAGGPLRRLLPPVMGSRLEFGPLGGECRLRLYLSGDTLLFDGLDEIGHRYPDTDLAVLQLGGTRLPDGDPHGRRGTGHRLRLTGHRRGASRHPASRIVVAIRFTCRHVHRENHHAVCAPPRRPGARHTAMLWGGANPPGTPAELRTYLTSLRTFRHRTRRAGADVELSNHPNDHGLQRAEQLRTDPGGPNPFVLGRRRTDRYLAVMESMLRGRLADAS